jgi:hypothetical protein
MIGLIEFHNYVLICYMFVLLSVEIGYQLGTNISRKSASVTVPG